MKKISDNLENLTLVEELLPHLKSLGNERYIISKGKFMDGKRTVDYSKISMRAPVKILFNWAGLFIPIWVVQENVPVFAIDTEGYYFADSRLEIPESFYRRMDSMNLKESKMRKYYQ